MPIGLASRIDKPVVQTRAVLASTDPVALDYHSAKYILYPNSGIKFHNPDDEESPTHQYLKACDRHGGGTFDEERVAIESYDFKSDKLQNDSQLAVIGPKEWGSKPKAILKYLVLRYGSFLI